MPKHFYITLFLFSGFFLSACGGGGSSSKIDLSLYLYPESSRTQTYNVYGCNETVCESTSSETETTTVDGNNITIFEDEELLDSITINKDTITYTDGEEPFELDRFVRAEKAFSFENEGENTQIIFGPFSSKTFKLTEDIQRTDEDVIIWIDGSKVTEDVEEAYYAVEVTYYAKGIGEVGELGFTCPLSIKDSLDLETDFKTLCDAESSGFDAEILVSEVLN